MKTGIYKILNKVNGKVYIGSAVDIAKRWRDHKWYLKHNKQHNSHLQSAWNKYGCDSFEFSIILECTINELLIKEREIILEYDAFNNACGYNVNDPEHMFLNKKHTEETKIKLSAQKMGEKNPMYGKYGENHHFFNKNHSKDSRTKMSLSHIGVPTNRRTHSKLTIDNVIEIRRLYSEEKISQLKIANKFNVSYAAINKIITKKMWSQIP